MRRGFQQSNPASSWREADYGAFGNIIKEQASSPDNCNYLCTGKEWYSDHGINLYYYGARWYDPSIGRFTQTDPVKEYSNPYSLALNNPIALRDAWGLTSIEKWLQYLSQPDWVMRWDVRMGFADRRPEGSLQYELETRDMGAVPDATNYYIPYMTVTRPPDYSRGTPYSFIQSREAWTEYYNTPPTPIPNSGMFAMPNIVVIFHRAEYSAIPWEPGMIAEVRSNSLLQRLIRGITGDETSHALVVVGSDELADANFCAGGPAGYITSSAESWDYFNPHGGRQGVIAIAVWYPPEGGGWGTAEAARALAGGLTQYASIPWGIGMNYATGLDWEPDRYHCFEFCLLSAGLPVAQSPEAFRQVLGANGWRRVALGP